MNRCETLWWFIDSPVMLQVLVAVAVLPLLCDPGSPLAQVTWSPWSPCTHSCEAGLQSRRLTACSDTGDMCQVRYRRVKECAGYSSWRYQIQRVVGRYSGKQVLPKHKDCYHFAVLF